MIKVRKITYHGRSIIRKFDSYSEAMSFIGDDREFMSSTLLGTHYKNKRGDTFWLIVN